MTDDKQTEYDSHRVTTRMPIKPPGYPCTLTRTRQAQAGASGPEVHRQREGRGGSLKRTPSAQAHSEAVHLNGLVPCKGAGKRSEPPVLGEERHAPGG